MAKIFFEESVTNSIFYMFSICQNMLSGHEEVFDEEDAEYKIVSDDSMSFNNQIKFSDFFILHNIKCEYSEEEVENILRMCFCKDAYTSKLGMDLFKNIDLLKHKNIITKFKLYTSENDGWWAIFAVRRILKKVLEFKE